MNINPLNCVLLGGTSLAMLIFAFVSEYVYGYHPCTLCLQQRYPHILIVLLCLIIFIWKNRIFAIYVLNILLISTSVVLAFYHVGVENDIFVGPASCSPYDLSNNSDKSSEALLFEILSKPIISCKKVSWSFLNLSMATWNLIISVILLFCWTFSLKQLINSNYPRSASQ